MRDEEMPATCQERAQKRPDAKVWRYSVYLKYWTLELGPLMVYPEVQSPPNFSISPKALDVTFCGCWSIRQSPVCYSYSMGWNLEQVRLQGSCLPRSWSSIALDGTRPANAALLVRGVVFLA